MKLHNLLKEKSHHAMRVAIFPLILLAFLLASGAIARADEQAESYTKDSCPLCNVGGMELTKARGSANTLECIYGSQDPDKPGAQVKYTRQEGPGEKNEYDKYQDKRSTSDCVRSASGRMGCGTSFVLADQFKTEVTVYLPYPAKSSSAEKEAIKNKARALRDQLVACVKSSPPTKGVKADVQEKLDGTIIGYDYGMRYLRLVLEYGGDIYETATDENGDFAFPVKIKEGEEYELTVHFENIRDGQVFYRLLYRDKPDPVKLVLRVKDGAIIQLRIHLGTKEHIAWKPSGMSLEELRLEKLFDEPAINPLVTYISTYIHMLEALTVYTDAFGARLAFQLPIDVVLFSEEPTRYHYPPGKSRITFDNERSLHTCPARPVQQYHEFSHYVMHALYNGKWPAPVNPTVPEVNHGGYANPSTSDSFVEGFAHFMSILIHQELGDTIPHKKEGLMKSLSEDKMVCLEELETNYLAWDRGGKAEELAAAGVLWDLFDGKADYQRPTEAFEIAYQSMLDSYDVNKNGALDYAELIGMILMTKFSSSFTDEDCNALLNAGDQVLLFQRTGVARSGPGEALDTALLDKYKDNDLLSRYDQHSRRALDVDELRVYVESANKNAKNPQHYAKNLITVYDRDNDKMLGETELVHMLAGEEQCSGMAKKYDLNADTFIDMSELVKIAEERGEALLDNINPGELGALAPDGKIPRSLSLDDFVRQCQSANRDDDDIEIPFQEIWAILRQYQQDFTAVYKSFVDKYPDQRKEIDEIFKAHGFFADVNPHNKQWDTGEEIGPAADASRTSRRSVQPLPGQFIKVDNSVPYYDVAVVFPFQPHLSYVTRTSNDNGLVYVPMPPESYHALITVEAEGVKTKNPLTFSTNLFNATYEDSVKQGYFLEYEFELEGEIPVLPSFPFAESGSESGSNVLLIIVVIAIIAAVAMPFILLRRKK